MDRPVALLAVAFLGAVASAALVSLALAPDASSSAAGPDPGFAQVAGRLTSLESELSRIDGRLRSLELSPLEPAGAGQVVPLGTPDLAALDERLAALESGLGGVASLAPTERVVGDAILEQVSEAVQVLRAEEELARDAEREERRAERRADALAELATALSLDEWQLGEVAALLDQGSASRDEIRELYDIDGDRDAMRDAMEALAADLSARTDGILTADQAAKLEELGGLGAFDGGGRGGPGGGGFGGGGGGGMGRGRRGR